MFDLSVTTNLVVFAVMCAVALALIFFAVDIFASKKPSVAVKATATVFGALALVIGLASAFAAIGLKVGFVTLVGSDITLWSLRVPHIAGVVTLANYPVVWALAAALVALALLDLIGGERRRFFFCGNGNCGGFSRVARGSEKRNGARRGGIQRGERRQKAV